MLGGLYGDLPPPSSAAEEDSSKPTPNVWSSSTKMAPATLRKPASLFAPPQTLLRAQPKPKPTTTITTTANPKPVLSSTTPAPPPEDSLQPALVGVQSTVLEEYDPARPNDYEEYRRERKRKAREAEMMRELERRRQEEEEEERERERERERDYNDNSRLNVSGEEAWRRRAAMSGSAPRSPSPPPLPGNSDGFIIGKSETGGLGVGAGGQMTAAQRMMAKMGWKEGQGLGKQEQGITTPLMAKKTDRRAGVIVNASDNSNSNSSKKVVKSVNFNGVPTKVLLLRNMRMPSKKMESRVAALETEVATLKSAMQVMLLTATENHEQLVALLSKNHGCLNEEDSAAKSSTMLHRENLDEFRQSTKKVELPMFDGEDPAGWIVHAEIYFQVLGTHPDVKVNLAQLCMDGSTIHFFKSLLNENLSLTWEQLKNALLEHYGGIGEGDIFERLAAIQQTNSVEEYIQEFERLTTQVPRLPDEQYFGYFVHGLRGGIKGRVRNLRSLGPLPRSRLMNLARAVELELREGQEGWVGSRNGFGMGSGNRIGLSHANTSHELGRGSGSEIVMNRTT